MVVSSDRTLTADLRRAAPATQDGSPGEEWGLSAEEENGGNTLCNPGSVETTDLVLDLSFLPSLPGTWRYWLVCLPDFLLGRWREANSVELSTRGSSWQ